MSIHSPTPKRAWVPAIPWLTCDALDALDAQPSTYFGPNADSPNADSLTPMPVPPDVLEFINAIENLPNYTPDTYRELLACLSPPQAAFSGTCESTLCAKGMTQKRGQNQIGCARAEKRRRLNKGAGEGQTAQECINSSCTDELCYRVLLHMFPGRGHDVISALFAEHVMAYQTKNNLNLVDLAIKYDHRHLTEKMVKLRDESIRMLRRQFFGLSGTSSHRYFLPSHSSGDINIEHVDYLISPDYRFMNNQVGGIVLYGRNEVYSNAVVKTAQLAINKCPTFADELVRLQAVPLYLLRYTGVLLLFIILQSRPKSSGTRPESFNEGFYNNSEDIRRLEKHFAIIKKCPLLLEHAQALFKKVVSR